MKSYRVHLIRNGSTDENLQGKYIGVTDVALSKKGKNRLSEMNEKSGFPKVSVVFSSPLKRCIETAKIIYPSTRPIIINDIKECNFGDWEGKSAKELEKDNDFVNWLNNSRNVSPPHGESGIVFAHRICDAFEKIVSGVIKSGITDSAIVTHGGVIMILLAAYGLPKASSFEWMTENGCGYSLRITPGLWMRSMVCEVYSRIPTAFDGESEKIINVAREAANRVYGNKD